MPIQDSDPSMGESAMRRGVTAARAGLRSVAAANLELAAEHLPDDPNVWLWLAWAANSPDNMIRCLERVLELSPDHSAASAGLAWALALAKDAPAPAVVVAASAMVEPTEPTVTPVEIETTPVPSVVPVVDPQDVWDGEPAPVSHVAAETIRETTPEWRDDPVPAEPPRRRWDELLQRGPDLRTGTITVAPTSLEPPPLPTIQAEPEIARPTWSDEAPVNPEPDANADVETLAKSFHPPMEAAPANAQPLVMVVDDSPTVRKLVSLTLERRGFRVVSAFDGVAAIKELGSCRPDLILLDINMPRLDGYRLCKLIKKHEATQSIPVVMLSGKDGMFDKLRGRLVGCSDYITKPFEADALTQKVARYLTPASSSL